MKISILELIGDLLTMNPQRYEHTAWLRSFRISPLVALVICVGSAVVFALVVNFICSQ